jgi:hypothetical protein
LPPGVRVRRPSASRRRGPRSRAEVDAERQKLHDDTNREIDATIAEFRAALPREQRRPSATRKNSFALRANRFDLLP